MAKRAQTGERKKKRRTVLYVLLPVALFFLFLWSLRIETITVSGCEFYTEEELASYIFEDPVEKNYLYAWLNYRFGKRKEIPFLAGYTIEFSGINEVHLTVYEKNIIGYVDYMGSHMYFDKDGTIVESSNETWEGVPQITGLSFEYIVLYKPLPVENETAFTQILNLTQMIRKYEIPVDNVYFDSRFDATLFIGGIRVLLGDKSDMEDKMAELTGMLRELKNLSGTLHLEKYDRTAMNPAYPFIRDMTEETEASSLPEPAVQEPLEESSEAPEPENPG